MDTKDIMQFFDLTDEEKEKLAEELKSSQETLNQSVNYQLCCKYLKNYFFDNSDNIAERAQKPEDVQSVINVLLDEMRSDLGITIPAKYYNLSICIENRKDKRRKRKSVIIEFDDAKNECECSLIAMIVINGQKSYLTSEYYASDNTFCLGEFSADGHCCYEYKINGIEDFRKVIFN